MMYRFFTIVAILAALSCQRPESAFENHVTIEISRYEVNDKMVTGCLPILKPESVLLKFNRRFSYLLINIPEMHQPEKHPERTRINDLYPDTVAIVNLYMEEYLKDQRLIGYFEETIEPIENPNFTPDRTYSSDELMEVASKFFFCDQVNPDSSIQAHVCIGLNGVAEAAWEKDYTLLSAFCYEAIFYGISDDEHSEIWDVFGTEQDEAVKHFRAQITSLDQYLENVKLDVFKRMKDNETLRAELLAYYKANANNLAFKIEN